MAAKPKAHSESVAGAEPRLRILDLGVMNYPDAIALQQDFRSKRILGELPDTLLLLEHPPVFTCGRGSSPEEFRTPRSMLQQRGFAVHEVDRGGKTTYHGPGQLVAYPIISLEARRLSVRGYVALLEQCVIQALQEWGLTAGRWPNHPGVWTGDKKIAAVGIHVRRGVTIHGLAVNVHPDLSHFAHIVPCGIKDAEVTSIATELGAAPTMTEAKASVARHLADLLTAARASRPATATPVLPL